MMIFFKRPLNSKTVLMLFHVCVYDMITCGCFYKAYHQRSKKLGNFNCFKLFKVLQPAIRLFSDKTKVFKLKSCFKAKNVSIGKPQLDWILILSGKVKQTV